MSLFAELKRRNVFRVGIAYIVLAWLLLQVGDTLAPALDAADRVLLHRPAGIGYPLEEVAGAVRAPATVHDSVDDIVATLCREVRPGDHVLIMSNGGFGGIHGKLATALEAA